MTPTTLPSPFNPPYAIPINEIPQIQKRVGLMGPSGSGKTFSALTFPNPVVADFDGNLSRHVNRTDVTVLKFNDTSWIKDRLKYNFNANLIKYPAKDAFLWWLKGDALKLVESQTLIVDSWSTLQDEFDKQRTLQPEYSKDGSINDFAFWADKIDYSKDVCGCFKALRCDVVVTFHEQDQRELLGKMNGKVEPLMQGKFNKEMGKYFTEFYRCIVKSKVDASANTVGSEYFWQTASTGEVAVLKTRMTNAPFLIKPHSSSIDYTK